MTDQPSPTPNPVSKQDATALIGVIAALQGSLTAGELEGRVLDELAATLVWAGLLERDPDGSLPSAGRTGLALDGLDQRIRHALGETDTVPPPAPEAVAHVLLFATEAEAVSAGAAIEGLLAPPHVEPVPDRGPDLLEPDAGHGQGWYLSVVCPELPPDPAFREREHALEEVARRFGGTYTGFQGAPR